MTDTQFTILVQNIPTIIAALAAGFASVYVVIVSRKVDVVHGIVNGNLSKITAKLEASDIKVANQDTLIAALTSKQGPVGETGATGDIGPRGETGRQGDIGSSSRGQGKWND